MHEYNCCTSKKKIQLHFQHTDALQTHWFGLHLGSNNWFFPLLNACYVHFNHPFTKFFLQKLDPHKIRQKK